MERPNTVAGLEAKRTELRNELKAAKNAVKAVKVGIQHVEAAMRLFTSDAPRAIPRRDAKFRAERGQMRRFCMNQLKNVTKPLTSQIIADEYLKDRNMQADHDTYVIMRKRVGICLNTLKNNGIIEAIPMEGLHKGWRVVQTDNAMSAQII